MRPTDITWAPATYRIHRRAGEQRVDGVRWAHFGVAASVQPDGFGQYTLTHLPSGYAIGADFPTAEAAQRFAEAIAPLRDDWATVTPTTAFSDTFCREVTRIDRAIRMIAEVCA